MNSAPCLIAELEFFSVHPGRVDFWWEGAPRVRFSRVFSADFFSWMVQFFLAAWMALLSCGMSTLVEGLDGSFLDGKLSQKVLSAGLEKLSPENLDLSLTELSVSGTPKLNFPLTHFSTTLQSAGRPRCSLVTGAPAEIERL